VFSQVAIVIIGLFLIVVGIRDGDYLNIGLGVMVAAFAGTTLYKLKTGE
jgi:hypothetical protein